MGWALKLNNRICNRHSAFVLSFKIASDLSTPSSLDILALQFAIQEVTTHSYDIGGYANIGILSGNTTWTTFYVPLTSLSQETHQLQFIIKNKSQASESVYLDDIQLFYNPDISINPLKWVIKPKLNIPLELSFSLNNQNSIWIP